MFQDIINAITYKDGWHILYGESEGRPYVQIAVDSSADIAKCAFTGAIVPWKSGKRYLSPHMCRQEVVCTVLGAIKDAEAHETHEWFKYKGAAIYNPHLDPDKLVDFAKLSNMNMRANAMTMEES